jgi:hypothetical protein
VADLFDKRLSRDILVKDIMSGKETDLRTRFLDHHVVEAFSSSGKRIMSFLVCVDLYGEETPWRDFFFIVSMERDLYRAERALILKDEGFLDLFKGPPESYSKPRCQVD